MSDRNPSWWISPGASSDMDTRVRVPPWLVFICWLGAWPHLSIWLWHRLFNYIVSPCSQYHVLLVMMLSSFYLSLRVLTLFVREPWQWCGLRFIISYYLWAATTSRCEYYSFASDLFAVIGFRSVLCPALSWLTVACCGTCTYPPTKEQHFYFFHFA